MPDSRGQSRKWRFTKMQGLGNDFVVLCEAVHGAHPIITSDLARKICDRHFGIGADQILILKPIPSQAGSPVTASEGKPPAFEMLIWNADGSEVETCGNGLRAAALFVQEHGIPAQAKCEPVPAGQPEYRILTRAGWNPVAIQGGVVSVSLGVPRGLEPEETIRAGSHALRFIPVDVGNPHAVFFVSRPNEWPLGVLGPELETHERFPHRTNVEQVQVIDAHTLRVDVWERGAGLTFACGSGACAAAVAAIHARRAKSPVTVELPGGRAQVRWEGPGHPVILIGPATEVFTGEAVF